MVYEEVEASRMAGYFLRKYENTQGVGNKKVIIAQLVSTKTPHVTFG